MAAWHVQKGLLLLLQNFMFVFDMCFVEGFSSPFQIYE